MSKKKFLKITLSDNDFRNELSSVSHYISELIAYDKADRLNKIQESVDTLKEFVIYVLIATVKLESKFGSCDYFENLDDYIRKCVKVSICNENEIPDWNNQEDCYIVLDDSLYNFLV